jgi:AcrR family transcriptional regulator
MSNPRNSSPGKKRLSKEERQALILESALNLLAEKSLEEVRSLEIAQGAGVSEALVFRYFDSKEEILLMAVTRYLEDYFQERAELLRGKDLGAWASNFAQVLQQEGKRALRHYYAVFFSAFDRYPALQDRVHELYQAYTKLLEEIGLSRPWDLIARVEGLIFLWTINDEIDLEEGLLNIAHEVNLDP